MVSLLFFLPTFIFISLLNLSFCSDILSSIFDTMLESNSKTKEIFKAFHYLSKKEYEINSEEGIQRYKIFKSNLMKIKEINSQNLGYTLGINFSADLTDQEYSQKYLTTFDLKQIKAQINQDVTSNGRNVKFSQKELKTLLNKRVVEPIPEYEDITPDNAFFDWEEFLFPAKDQQQCGSCWAFATQSALEARYRIDEVPLPGPLSVQHLLDCNNWDEDDLDGYFNKRCQGGFPHKALQFLSRSQNSAFLEKDYPYVSGNDGTTNFKCKAKDVLFTKGKPRFKSGGYFHCANDPQTLLSSDIPCDLKTWHYNLMTSPMVVFLDGKGPSFRFYRKGDLKFNSLDCYERNHAVVAFAWVRKCNTPNESKKCFKVLNSWGSTWGQNGKAQVVYSPEIYNTCFMTDYAVVPEYPE
jgi:C1A family cysteine protease